MITIPGRGPTRVEQSSEGNYPIPWTTSLMHDSDRSQKKKKCNFPGYKRSSEYHKRGDGDQAKKSRLHLTSFTKRSVHFQAEQKHSVNANKGEVPAQALQKSPFRVKEKSSALEMKDIPALR